MRGPSLLVRADEVIEYRDKIPAVHQSANGTKRTWACALQMSAIGVKRTLAALTRIPLARR